ncbi:MAG: chemotaxis response regulator protein-glutamate methylesterase [Acidimicrobiales bacterium]
MTIKVLVVDDSVVIRKILTDVINRDPDLEVVGTASNGVIALEKLPLLKPDVLTLDIEMPEMDGLETLQQIREDDDRLPIIMFSTLSTKGGEATLDALCSGATDYVTKPANVGKAKESFDQVSNELLPLLKFFGVQGHGKRPRKSAPVNTRVETRHTIRAVVVGSSTGGPLALETLLCAPSKPFSVPMLIVQHMPPKFTRTMAERLDKKCASQVVEAEHGVVIEPGTVYIAPGGRHMVVREWAGKERIELHDGPHVNSCRPAVDVLFESSTKIYGADQLGVILTGMGYDGRAGSRILAQAGGDVFAQDEATSVVWGMPGAVVEDETACRVLPIEQMAAAIVQRLPATAGSA